MSNGTSSPVWFVTGCSSGLGRSLVEAILDGGHNCVATARNIRSLAQLSEGYPHQLLTLPLDTTDRGACAQAIRAALARFDRIDVLVNNAGVGYNAAVEEGEEAEIARLFETNFFGPAALIRSVLPYMRARRSGHIVNVSSVAGVIGNMGSGYYAASKFALEGLSEALAKEVEEFAIRVSIVEPGPFRTQFQGTSMRTPATPVNAYERTAIARREQQRKASGSQAGDPARAAEIIFQLVASSSPPFRLALGRVGWDVIFEKLAKQRAEMEPLREIAYSADYPKP